MNSQQAEFRTSLAAANVYFWICLIAGVFLALLGFVPFLDGKGPNIVTAIMLPIGAIVAAIGYWMRKRALNDRSPKLIINSEAIHAPAVAAKPIPWSDVEKIVFVRQRPKKPGYMAIDVTGDVARFEPSRFAKSMAKVNSMLSGGEIVIQSMDLDGDHDQIKAAILAANPHVAIVDK